MTTVPHTKSKIIPAGKKLKKDKLGRPCSSINPLTTKLVEVPIRVSVPPRIAKYDSGINNLDGG
ncbi:hypothetical protein GCM10027342_14860 [Photobacterium alginatilyticum]